MKTKNIIKIGSFIFLTILINSCKKNKETKGCINPNSLNYNKDATIDDGSCQIIDPKQRYLILEIGATHCAPCGSYAIPSLEKTIYELGAENVCALSIHANGDWPLHSNTSYELANYKHYYDMSIPRFAGASKMLFVGVNRDINENVRRIKEDALKTLALSPTINCNVQKEIIEDSVILNITAKFHSNGNGEYLLSAYVLEDGIVQPQLMRNPAGNDTIKKDMVHNHVVRASFGPTFGTLLKSSNLIPQGTIIKRNLSLTLDKTWNKENLHYAVIIWKKDSKGDYYFENATVL